MQRLGPIAAATRTSAEERAAREADRDRLWRACQGRRRRRRRPFAATRATPRRRSTRRWPMWRAGPCQLAVLPLEDLLGLEEQPNLPGTHRRASELAPPPRRRSRHPARRAAVARPDRRLNARAASAGAIRGERPPNDPARDLPAPVPQGLHLRRRGPARALPGGLGISHVYASPIGTARAGSTHGYDQVDPTRINPELGGEDGFRSAGRGAEGGGAGRSSWTSCRTTWRWGRPTTAGGWTCSGMAGQRVTPSCSTSTGRPPIPALKGKVARALPGRALCRGPGRRRPAAEARRGDGRAGSPGRTTRTAFPLRPRGPGRRGRHGVDLGEVLRWTPTSSRAARGCTSLLERQHYRLAWWKTAGDEINWRRFFDITELAG